MKCLYQNSNYSRGYSNEISLFPYWSSKQIAGGSFVEAVLNVSITILYRTKERDQSSIYLFLKVSWSKIKEFLQNTNGFFILFIVSIYIKLNLSLLTNFSQWSLQIIYLSLVFCWISLLVSNNLSIKTFSYDFEFYINSYWYIIYRSGLLSY